MEKLKEGTVNFGENIDPSIPIYGMSDEDLGIKEGEQEEEIDDEFLDDLRYAVEDLNDSLWLYKAELKTGYYEGVQLYIGEDENAYEFLGEDESPSESELTLIKKEEQDIIEQAAKDMGFFKWSSGWTQSKINA
jgi:hypothetical protein